ncbi:MAG: hypothetical protein SF051_13905 [Elusimicrobiota bacterium]|nr:hypothetical protein [Elusimicrobiota bacterium]
MLLATASWAMAVAVRVPQLPARFSPARFTASWSAWEQPLISAYSAAHTQRLTLSPQLKSFVPVVSVAKANGEAPTYAPRPAQMSLLMNHLQESGMTPEAFRDLAPEERIRTLQKAYDTMSAGLEEYGRQLVDAARQAEEAGNAAALYEAQSLLSLIIRIHADYIAPKTQLEFEASRNAAFAAHARLTASTVERAEEAGMTTLNDAARADAKTGDAVAGAPGARASAADPGASSRDALLGPLTRGRIPDGLLEAFTAEHARYKENDDPRLALQALEGFTRIMGSPFADETEIARAIAGVGLVAREAPTQQARDRAVRALSLQRFAAPEFEALRTDAIREIARGDADKEVLASIIEALTAQADKRPDPIVSDALADVERIWKKRFSVPTPLVAEEMRKKGGATLFKGVLSLAGSIFGYFHVPTALPGFLSFALPVLPYLPYLIMIGGAIAVVNVLWGLYKLVRAGPKD